jgi:hypothetical protein
VVHWLLASSIVLRGLSMQSDQKTRQPERLQASLVLHRKGSTNLLIVLRRQTKYCYHQLLERGLLLESSSQMTA